MLRDYLMDRTPEDNPLRMDLTWSDDDLTRAMAVAAREYNSIPPFTDVVSPDALPDDTNLFLDGAAWAACRLLVNKERRNAVKYSAGGVSGDVSGTQIKMLEQMGGEFRESFFNTAKSLKIARNLNAAYGHF